MKRITIAGALIALFASSSAFGTAVQACHKQADEKKLGGAARDSFIKKCRKDMTDEATKACNAEAKEKKLAGAAGMSFVNKCVKDATAPPPPAKKS